MGGRSGGGTHGYVPTPLEQDGVGDSAGEGFGTGAFAVHGKAAGSRGGVGEGKVMSRREEST